MKHPFLSQLTVLERERLLKLAMALDLKRTHSELPAIVGGKRGERIPLSFAQQRLWFLAQLEGVSEAYHIPFGLGLKGDLDQTALRQALDRIVKRHEVLRTVFAFTEGEPQQRIAAREDSRFHLLEHDLREHADAQAELARLVELEAKASFDLERGPLIRGRLIRVADAEHVLLITMHHIVSDVWSMGLLAKELSELYRAFLRGEGDPLPELEVQYADYTVWQREWMAGEVLQQQTDYWKKALSGVPAVLEIPGDHARPAMQDFAGGFLELELDEKVTAGLKELSRRHGTTLYMTLLAGWSALLSRLTGQEDVVIGTPSANRGRREIEELIGFFVNTLAVRVDLSGGPTVGELLGRVKGQALAAQQHQDIPFEQVVELLQPVRSLSHNPLFQVMFAWQNASSDGLQMPGLEIRPVPPPPYRIAKFDLTLFLQEAGDKIVGGLEYAAALFERGTVERYAGYLRRLLEGMVADGEQQVERLPMLSEREREQVVNGWNATKVAYPSDRCVHELFEEQVEKRPEAVAVVFEGEELSYGELNRRANRLAHHLRGLGVKPDDRVAICVERGIEMIVGLLGVLKAGGAYVPMDPAYPAERLRYMLEDSAPVALLTQSELAGLFQGVGKELAVVELDAAVAAWSEQPESNLDTACIGLTPQHLAYMIYTSGSTGQPKGVAIEHGNTVNFVCWAQSSFAFEILERTLFSTSLNFDLSVYECFVPLITGATVRIVPDAIHLVQAQVDVTLINTVPSAMKALVEAEGIPEKVRTVNLAGEPLKRTLVERIFATTGVELVCNLYGPSEATTYSTWVAMRRGDPFASHIGKPIANTRVYILDAQQQPVPVGVAGEIYIGGAGVARGYWNRPELTAEKFLKDPFVDEAGARMYRTGDLGRWRADGNIEFLGRNDFQVKIRGYRIELGEIEARLTEYPGVREAVVVAREETPGDKRLVAYYTTVEEGVSAEGLRGHLSAKLPEYMVPAAYVRMESMPLTANGKLDRKGLPAPEGDAYAVRGYEAPQGEIETRLAEIWADVLKVERVGRHDNFFALGGHSLLAVTGIERMHRIGLQVDVRALFATPTVAELAAAAGPQETVEVPPNRIPLGCEAIVPEMLPLVELTAEEIGVVVSSVAGGAANVQDIYPLAPLQEGILFHHLMGGEGDPYLLAVQVSFDSRSRLDGYIEALQAVIDRHDILRTAVVWEGMREPVQVVWRRAPLQVEEVELDPAEGEISEQLNARFNLRRFRMDVRQAPLLRLYISYDGKNQRWLMMQLLHHLAGDHSTLEVMADEIQAHLLGEAEQLPQALPFRNLVAQARLGVSREEHEEFFRGMLGDVEEPTAPFGLLDAQGDGSGIEEGLLELDADLAGRMRRQGRRLGVSAASICHLAWARVLSKVSGREDVVFGTVLFGRMQGGEGAGRVMGLFINTLPIRIEAGAEGAEAAVLRTHGLLADLMGHEHASLALAQRCSGVPAPAPLFSSLLNYRHIRQARSAQAKQERQGIQMLSGEERTNYPLVLSVNDLGEGVSLSAQAPVTIGPMRVCEFMRRALESLVEALEEAPGKAVRTLEVLPAAEREQVVNGWNATERAYPSDKCVHELFEEQVEKRPEAVAVVFEGEELSYRELNRRANRLAHYLRELGVKPDDRVAICVERGIEMMVGLLGVLKAGGAYVPMDPAYPAERLRYMLEDSAPVALLTQSDLAGLFQGVANGLAVIELDAADPAWQDQPERNLDAARIGLTPQHLAYMIYTSGSTGQPKGVMIPHSALTNFLCSMQQEPGLRPDDVVLSITTLSFDIVALEVYLPLTQGAHFRILRREVCMDGVRLRNELQHGGVTIMQATPATWQMLLHAGWEGTNGLKVLSGGEALSADLARKLVSRSSSAWNMYGPTETTVWSLVQELERLGNGVAIGRPIANTRVYILDAQQQPVPVGVSGELYIGGAGVARGYWNRPELTAEKFLKDPFVDEAGARMYRTGDLGRWLADGNIEFLGRNDFQVKIRGYRIELGEIEAKLAEYPGVQEAVVAAREDTPGDKRLVAYYTTVDEGVSAEALRSHLAAKLPEYMVPAAYVRLESMPLTANGKLDRKGLPVPEGDAYIRRGYEAPQGETETRLAKIWAEVLKLERVGRYDNFFELGGHSLLAVRAVSRMRQALGVEVAIQDIFAHPVLADLGRALQGAAHGEMLAIERAKRGERIPLSFAQQRLWFLAQMEGVSEAYHIPLGLGLKGDLDRPALRQALDRIVGRHEVLRTVFAFTEGEPEQRIAAREESRFHLLEHDLRGHADAKAELESLVELEAKAPFDLETGPLIRGRLMRVADQEHVLLLTMHHIVSDEWSMGLLAKELSELYRAFLRGEGDPLPELEVQYADYTVWQREWMAGEVLQQQTDYWKEALSGAPAVLEIPGDCARPAMQDFAGGFLELELDEKVTAGLKELSRRQGTTLYMTLLAGWSALLSRLSGQEDVVIGTPSANRGRREIEELIGFFVNTLAVRVDLSGGPTVRELLGRVKGQALAAQQHQDIPFEQVVELLQPVRSLSHNPLFQVMFSWQNATTDVLQMPGVDIRPVPPPPYRIAKFDLTLFLQEAGDRIVGGLEYAAALFERGTVERYAGYFRRLLEGMVADGEQQVERLPMLSEWEREQVVNGWNATEAADRSEPWVQELFEEIGQPIANTRVYILDLHGEPVPAGVRGEVYVGDGPSRMYRTGDLGRWRADGNIEFLGRSDLQVRMRGYRIDLGETETTLAAYPGVREAVVVAREDTPGDKRLVAYYTAVEEGVSAEELRAHLSAKLPEYMAPAAYVQLESMPLTANGKLDRQGLPAPDGYAVRGYESPQGEIETKLAEIWGEVLQLERVGRHDNFFTLGGRSLLAVTVIERMHRIGLQVDARALFATPTVAELAAAVGPQETVVEVPPNRIPSGCEAILPEMLPLVELTAEEIAAVVSSVAGGAANVQDIYPLAPLQEGILFHHLMGGEGDPYLLAVQFSFDNRALLDRYIEALQAVIDRHDILRTAVVWEGLGEPVQVVWRRAPLQVEEVELDPAEGEISEQLNARFNLRRFRMDVRQAPLLRLYISYDGKNGRWLMMQLLHHLVGDHSGLEVMYDEIQAHLLGEAEQLPQALPFRNLVAQARLGVRREEHEEFFRGMLGDVEEPTAPFGLLDAQGDGSGIEEGLLELDADLAGRMRRQGRRLGVSAASICHLAWARVLSKVSGREDVVFGTVLFGRMQGGEGADRVMGLFINTLPIRIEAGAEGAEAAVLRTHGLLADLMGHEHASLTLAQRCSAVPAPAPLFSSLLNYRHVRQARSAQAKQERQGIEMLSGEERTNYPFVLSVNDLGEGVSLSAQAPVTIGPMRVCEFMRRALESLVEALEEAPGKAVRTLEVLPAAEREQVVNGWNEAKAYPSKRCVHELFEEQVEKRPEAVAVVFEGEELSYGELNRRANRLAHYLRELGVKPDDRVAICVERGIEMIVGLLGVLKAGGAYVPMDPAYPAERLRYILEDSAPVALLTQAELGGLCRGLGKELSTIELDAENPVWREQPESNLDTARIGLTPQHLAYIIFTSGSTGTPRGVAVEHANVVRLFAATDAWFQFGNHDVWVLFHSYAFDFSVWEIWGALFYGGRLIVVSKELARSPQDFYSLICRQRVTILNQTPSAFRQFIAAQKESSGLHGLRHIIFGGESLEVATLKPWYERNGERQTELINMYGITETTVHVTYRPLEAADTGRGGASPIGCRIRDLRVYILDAQQQPVPVGVSGELYIGGAGVARGYWNRPELTAERFLKDPFVDEAGARMYRTGDLGRWLADGNIEFLGRNDFQVKIRGYRIELGEIEARLTEYPGVREAVVVAREDTPADKRLVAYYNAGEGGVSAEELRAHLSAKLPEYMVPAAYVRLESMPLTANGKLDRKGLPVPEGDAYIRRGYEAPQGEMETRLAKIWAEVLKLERVGRYDNFFELGGHSLLAVRAVSRMRQALGVEVAIQDIFAHPVLADLRRALQGAAHSELPAIMRAKRSERIPLSFAQQRLWFLAQMEGVSEAYHIPFGLRLKGDLDRPALRQALDRIVWRHEVLRTVFVFTEGEPEQRIAAREDSRFHLVEHDLRGHADAKAELESLVELEAKASFDLETGPLIRGRLIRVADEEHVLLLTMHHIVSDGWSMGLLAKELSELYRAFVSGEGDPLPELEVQYADYTVWQREWMAGEVLRQQTAYWKKTLSGAPAVLEIPGDCARPAIQDFAGGLIELGLDEKLTGGLKELSRRHGTTLYMTLLAGWSALLSRLSGQQDVVIGTPSANRGRREIENLIGFFVNTLAVRVDLSGGPTVGELLGRVKGQALVAQQHQDIPFEQVVELLQPERSLSHNPLFQVMFSWQNATTDEFQMRGVEIRPEPRDPHSVARFDLTLSLQEAGDRIVGGIGYATALFERGTVERYAGYFRRLLEGMVADGEQQVERLPMLSEREREQVVNGWNATKVAYPSDRCVHELFEEQVEKRPEAVAVVFEGEELSYAELNRRANRLAHHLRGLGVKPDDRVAICVERGIEMIVSLLGVLKAGGAYVPMDPAYPAERLRYMLEDSRPVALLTQRDLAGLFRGVGKELAVIELDAAVAAWQDQPESNLDAAHIGLTPQHLAYMIYTSGSAGQPKGVMVEHRSLTNYLEWAGTAYYRGPGSGSPLIHSIGFDGLVTTLFCPILSGQALTLPSPGVEMETVAKSGHGLPFTLVKVTPSHLKLLNRVLSSSDSICPTHALMIGGEALVTSDVIFWQKCFREVRLINHYGPTETTVGSCTYDISQPLIESSSIPIGRPIANTRVYILDAHGEPVPARVSGEIYIGGAGVARGYWNRPELTAEKFLKDPFVDEAGARMYRTGDLGRWLPDGNIEFLGRNDFQVKIRGYRIELGEIEARLTEYPGVREAVVVAREDTPGDKRLVAYYTTIEEGVTAEVLRSHLSAKLPEYMVPAAYVRLESLPLTANGKLDRKGLPAPEGDAYAVRGYEAPQGETEAKLAAIWAEVLQLERVSRHDNFFALGGHSLLILRVVVLLEQIGFYILATDLFKYPTIRSLATKLRQHGYGVSTVNSAITMKRAGAKRAGADPALFLAHEGAGELMYVSALAPHISLNGPIYGLPSQPVDEAPLRTVEGMAARMVQMIRCVQPAGPYRIAGWSAGGILAYEIATQLLGADQQVEFVGMLDTHLSKGVAPEESVTEFNDKHLLLGVIRSMVIRDDGSGQAAMEELESSSGSLDFEALVHKLQQLLSLPEIFIGLTAAQIRRWLVRLHAYGLAFSQYSPQHISIPVHLFAAHEGNSTDLALEWKPVVTEPHLRVIPVPGNHRSMMHQPNVELLGRALSDALRNATSDSAESYGTVYSPLFRLRDGKDKKSAPLFCIPGAGNNVTSFNELADCLDERVAIYGLQPRGLDGLVPHSTVPAASECYIRALEELHPKGPIQMLGHSYGGWIAFEMAQRLLEAGRDVVSVTLLDCDVPDNQETAHREFTRTEAIMELIDVFEQVAGHSLGLTKGDLDSLPENAQLALLHGRLVRENILHSRSAPEVLHSVFRTFAAALRTRYTPCRPYAGAVRLVLANDGRLDEHANLRRRASLAEGWRAWAPQVHCLNCPGNHITMLDRPHVAEVARLLASREPRRSADGYAGFFRVKPQQVPEPVRERKPTPVAAPPGGQGSL